MSRIILIIIIASLAGFESLARAADVKVLDALNAKFGLVNGALRFATGDGGLACAEIKTALCTGRIYLQGAHVAAWQPAGQEPVIFMSSKSNFETGKPIRGGVPICFPWFAAKEGDPSAPGHGFVRTMEWDVESTQLDSAGNVVIVLAVRSNEKTKIFWPSDFELRHRVSFGRQLTMQLEAKNTGPAPMKFEEALHTYFHVKDVSQAKVSGLEGVAYIDKVDGKKVKRQSGDITFTGETDRLYTNTKVTCVIDDPGLGRKITLQKTGSDATVVWNPGETKAKTIVDLGANDWPSMLCVEALNAGENDVTVQPGQTHRMQAAISIGP